MSHSPVRVGLVGAGGIAQVSHLPAYARMSDARVVAVCDADLGKARRVAERFNIPRVTASFEELVGWDEVDAVDICLPNHLHAPAGVAALESGKHVLVEKPFTRSREEAATLVAAAEKADRILMSGFNNRYRDDVRLLRKFVGRGELGSVYFAKAGWLMRAATWTGEGWRRSRKEAGGGALLDLGIQVLDVALWLMGMPKVISVSATAHPRPEGDNVESTAVGLIRLENEASLALEVSWGLLMEKDVAYLNLFGDEGAALLHPLRLRKRVDSTLRDATPETAPSKEAYRHSYETEIRHFVDCARDGTPPDSPGTEAVQVLSVLEALYRSAKEGCEVAAR